MANVVKKLDSEGFEWVFHRYQQADFQLELDSGIGFQKNIRLSAGRMEDSGGMH